VVQRKRRGCEGKMRVGGREATNEVELEFASLGFERQ